MTSVLRSWAELTPEWMTAALARRCPSAVAGEVKVLAEEVGTNARARVAISYARGEGPSSVFVKREGPLLHRLALVALGAFTAEARLAASGVVLPLATPRPYASAVDRARLACLVVMDDVAVEGGRPNDATAALSPGEVGSALEGLARLHAAYWERPLPASLGFLRPWRLGPSWAPVSAASLWRGRRRLGALAGSSWWPAAAGVRTLESQFRKSAALAASGPQTVLHGDPHPGNTYALPGGRTGLLDWQLVRLGSWSHDVGYFLVASLDVATRRTHERALVGGYLDALGRFGADPPSPEEAWRRLSASPAFGLSTWLHTLSFGRLQPVEVCLATIRRFAAAYEDYGTADSPLLGA